MRMLGPDKTTLGLQGRSYYTSHDLLASVVVSQLVLKNYKSCELSL